MSTDDDDPTDLYSSDDDIIFTEDDDTIADLLMLNVFVANQRCLVERTPCRTSMLTGKMYLMEILDGHPDICYQNFRMQKHVFMNFCDTLKQKGFLKDGKKCCVEEGVAMFLMIVGHTTRYRIIADRFQHSNNTIHKWFKKVLRTICSFGTEIICPTNQNVVHSQISRKYPHFKNAIGAIDGTHVAAYAPALRHSSFRGRKTNITQNVMLTCDFDMRFTFVYAGWEGTANDSRVFIDAVTRASNNFPLPQGDQFYLVDSGYPNIPGFLAPYRGSRYHLRDYRGQGRPRGKEELFNYRHSSCRNIIERCIGILKARFPILKFMPKFPLTRQRQIPTACCAIHNFIRQEHTLDRLFVEYSKDNMIFSEAPEAPEPSEAQEVIHFDSSQTTQMAQVRDEIATQMWNDYNRRHV